MGLCSWEKYMSHRLNGYAKELVSISVSGIIGWLVFPSTEVSPAGQFVCLDISIIGTDSHIIIKGIARAINYNPDFFIDG
ncbi:hypothetical protein ES703_104575 [subsurface metagenome]